MINPKKIATYTILFLVTILISSCSENTNIIVTEPSEPRLEEIDFSGTYLQKDLMGRPAIEIIFVAPEKKEEFKTRTPSSMESAFQPSFQNRLLSLNPNYTTNILGQDIATFTRLLATDVLNVSTTKTTSFYDKTNVFTGRALEDDVINSELLLIFGGLDGTDNPNLTDDHVNENDVTFLGTFPYLADPHR